VDSARIAELLKPFLSKSIPLEKLPLEKLSFRAEPEGSQSEPSGAAEEPAFLSPSQLQSISTYIDLLSRWNARINLTAIRDPEQIVTRHFGESLFVARALFPGRVDAGDSPAHVIDIGSGAGFPGLPIKIWASDIHLTLIESNQKKATFLREVARTLRLTNVNVFADRAEDFPPGSTLESRTVTLRAVEHFDRILPVAASLVRAGDRSALLIGEPQIRDIHRLVPAFTWSPPIRIPQSSATFLLVGRNQDGYVPQE